MNMLFGNIGSGAVPASENVVRYPSAPVDVSKEPAVMDDPPVMGEFESDSDPSLGLATRQLASDWHEGERFAPSWADNVGQQALNSNYVNGTVSSAGTAAARERAGEFGHGSASFAVGIEGVQGLMDGAAFGNAYFARDKPDIQEPAGRYMTLPPGYSHGDVAMPEQIAKIRAREANQASVYEAFLFGQG